MPPWHVAREEECKGNQRVVRGRLSNASGLWNDGTQLQTDVATGRMHSSKVWLDMLSLCDHLDDPCMSGGGWQVLETLKECSVVWCLRCWN